MASLQPIEFHGDLHDDHGTHKHFCPVPKDLEGKTIARFVCDAVNMWSIEFTDGTAVTIEAEVGNFGIPTMTLCNTCWEDQL